MNITRSDSHIPSAPAASMNQFQIPKGQNPLRLPFASFRLIFGLEKTGYAESTGSGAAYELLKSALQRLADKGAPSTVMLAAKIRNGCALHIVENKTDGMIEAYGPLGCKFDENCKSSRWCDGCAGGCKGHVIAPIRNERTDHSVCPFLPKPSLRYRQRSGSCNARRAHLFDLLRSTARQPFERNKDFNSNCEPERPEKAEDLDNQ